MVYLSVSLCISNHRNNIHRSAKRNDHRANKVALYTKYIVAVFMVLPFLLNPTMTSESVYTAVCLIVECQDVDNLTITLTTMMALHRLQVKVNDRQSTL